MRKFLLNWLVHSAALFVAVRIVPGIGTDGAWAVFVAALVLGLFNAFLKPLLIFATLPLNLISLGLFTFVINGFLLYLVARLVPGFFVAGFASAFWGALLLSAINFVFTFMLGKGSHVRIYHRREPVREAHNRIIDVEAVESEEKGGRYLENDSHLPE